jgi:hypothetical protein
MGVVAILSANQWQTKQTLSNQIDATQKSERVSEQRKFQLRNSYMVLLFGTGLLGIGLEILVVHHFKQILENTIFSFGNILAIYLLGTSLGAWFFQRYYKNDFAGTPTLLMGGLASSVLYTSILLSYAGQILSFLSPEDTTYIGHLRAELILAILIFLLPTLFMGALFSYLIAKMRPQESRPCIWSEHGRSRLSPLHFWTLVNTSNWRPNGTHRLLGSLCGSSLLGYDKSKLERPPPCASRYKWGITNFST